MIRTHLTLAALAGLFAPLLVSASPASAGTCTTPRITEAQPVDDGVLKVARVAGAISGGADGWEMKFDAWFCNPFASKIKIDSVKVTHLDGSTQIRSFTVLPLLPGTVPANDTEELVMVRDETQYPFPLPGQVKLTFNMSKNGTGIDPITKSYPVAVHTSPGPLGAYFFPAQQDDLGDNAYWRQSRHAEDNNFQRWAYDLTVQRWTGSVWVSHRSGTLGVLKEDAMSWDRPVYAMSDGVIIGCNRGAPDNHPGVENGNVPGGNLLWVRTGDETTLYAHLKQNSIPFSLCPFSDDQEHKLGDPNNLDDPANDPYRIYAGREIGRAGNSGNSTGGPHLHIHAFKGLPAIWGGSETGLDADARPLQFVNVKAQLSTGLNVISAAWNSITAPKLLPYDSRFAVNDCGYRPNQSVGEPEVVNLKVPGSCYLEMSNAMAQADLRPISIDVHGVGSSTNSNTVWRPNDGTPYVWFAGMTGTELQDAHNDLVASQGYRYLHLETYTSNGAIKHAAIWVKQPGPAQEAKAELTLSALTTFLNKPGYCPVSIAVSVKNNVPSYDAVIEQNSSGCVAKQTVPVTDYQNTYDNQKAAGRKLVYLDGYEILGTAYLSAIWYSGVSGNDDAVHGWGKADTKSFIDASSLYVRSVTEYTEAGSQSYAVLWRQAPDTTITSGPSGTTSSTSASFTFAASEPLGYYECKLDTGSWTSCSASMTWNVTGGAHTLKVRAIERGGLVDSSPAQRSWTVG